MYFNLPVSLFLATAVVVAATTPAPQRKLVSLSDRWSILDPTVGVDGLEFTFDYPVSTFIDQNMAYYELYDANCRVGGKLVSTGFTTSPLQDVAPGSVVDEENFSKDGKTARVEVSINPNTIASDQDVYSETITDDGPSAMVRFCVRFGLKTLGDSPIEVNFLETIVEMTIGLTSGFSVDAVNLSSKDRVVQTATEAYGVDGFLCEPGSNGTPLTDVATALAQGSLVTVCVTPEADALEDGVVMETIDSFEWTRDGAAITQQAIEAGAPASNLLTTFDAEACDGGAFCEFSSMLFAGFYQSEGIVSGSGVASVQFGSTGNRQRRRGLVAHDSPTTTRALQISAATEFDLSFPIQRGEARPKLAHGYHAAAADHPSHRWGALSLVVTFAMLLWS